MKKISITMVSLVGMAGLVFAQGTKPGAGSGAGSAAKPGAAPGAGSAGSAAKPGAPAAGGAAKAGAPAGAPAVKVEPPKPPEEIKTALKAMGARANCTGTGLGPDMKTEATFKGTTTNKAALDGWWIQSSMTGNMTGPDKKKLGTMKMESYMTYDTGAKKWRTIGVMNDGSSMAGTATMDAGKYEGSSDMWSAMGQAQFREHGDMTDPKAGMKMWGEMSMDKGKTWTKVYEMTCKK